MPTLKYDRNATGTGSGGSWLNAISDPAVLMSAAMSASSGGTVRHEFARGDNPWPFTINKTIAQGTERMEIVGVDPGNGSTRKPRFTFLVDESPITGFIRIQAGSALTSATVDGTGTSNLWWSPNTPNGWSGAFRASATGKIFFGRRTKVKASDAQAKGAAPNVPNTDWQYGYPSYGGILIYLSLGNPQSFAQFVRRPTGLNEKMLLVNRPVGGLEIAGMEFTDSDFALLVQNSTSSSLIDNVWIHDNDFVRSRKGCTIIGTGTLADYVNAGFRGLIFERNRGLELGQMLFHATGSPALDLAQIRNNLCRTNNTNEGSGAFYFDSVYTTDGSRIQCVHNWVDDARYDGKYWLDGSAFYSEYGSRSVEYAYNLVTNSKIAVHLNIGNGSHWFHHNTCRGITDVGVETNEAAVRIVSADLGTGVVSLGDGHVYCNIFDRFAMMIGITSFDYTGTTATRTRFYIHQNIARGRQSLDGNGIYAIQGNNGCFDNVRMFAYKNNLTDFQNTTLTGIEYDGADTLSNTTAQTTRLDPSSIMAKIPVPVGAADDLDVNYAAEAPLDIGTLPAMRAELPALVAI